jgi:NADPH:quinone reductase-like Zn-dependent oxidoreductase
MKAIIRSSYGSPEVLSLADIPKPAPDDNEILVNIRAVSLNASDVELLTAKPLYVRLSGFGFLTPKVRILGSDIAGVVEAVGSRITRFKPGDHVFGDTFWHGLGGLADYVCVPDDAPMSLKPENLSFEDAACLPQAGAIALQAVRDSGSVQPGQKVLINGAGGGAGIFAIQLAKLHGAEVTGVDNGGKLETMRQAGADHVVDYTTEDFTSLGETYDFILDLAAHRSIFTHRRALRPGGVYGMVGGAMSRILQVALLGPLISKFSGKKMSLLVIRPSTQDLEALLDLVEGGKITPVIDRRFRLDEAVEALRYLAQKRGRGKIVVTVA